MPHAPINTAEYGRLSGRGSRRWRQLAGYDFRPAGVARGRRTGSARRGRDAAAARCAFPRPAAARVAAGKALYDVIRLTTANGAGAVSAERATLDRPDTCIAGDAVPGRGERPRGALHMYR